MTEFQFERLLNDVALAMEMAPQQDGIEAPFENTPPRAANDNQRTWPLIPFPDGWCASC
jgi:hypothetical protein